jgi:hypothetical protein
MNACNVGLKNHNHADERPQSSKTSGVVAACRATGRPCTAGALPSRPSGHLLQQAMKVQSALRCAPAAIQEASKWTDAGYLRKPPELLSFLAVKRGSPVRPPCPLDSNKSQNSTCQACMAASSHEYLCRKQTGNHLPWYDEISR